MRLNDTEPRPKYKEFYGRNVNEMPKLVADSRVPMSVADIMKKRLEVRNSEDSELKASWHDTYFDTGDGVLYFPNGDLVVAYDSKALREMNSNSKLVGGALDLSNVDLKDVTGQRFTKAQLEKMVLGESLTLEQAKVHPLWIALARDNKLASDYAEMVFAETKERFDYDTNMGVYRDQAGKVPKMRAWVVGWVDGRSGAGGNYVLDDGSGRLVGVASETRK